MGILFLLTLLQILIWGEKVLTLCQKCIFFDKTTRFPLEIAKKKRFRLLFLKAMHILFLFTSLGQLRQHRSYFVHFQLKTKDILSFWMFLTFFSNLRWNLRIRHCFPGMMPKYIDFFFILQMKKTIPQKDTNLKKHFRLKISSKIFDCWFLDQNVL